jgi:phospholipid transport system transporter-binding protein
MNDNAVPVIEKQGDTYRVSGPLTFETVVALLPSVSEIEPGVGPIAVDLADVNRADSAGLALLVEWLRAARRANRPLVFTHIPPKLQALIHVTDLDGVLPEKVAS